MKLPGYLKYHSIRKGPEGAEMVFTIRRWHPGFWLEVWRAFRAHRIEMTIFGRAFVLQKGRPV